MPCEFRVLGQNMHGSSTLMLKVACVYIHIALRGVLMCGHLVWTLGT